MRIFRWPADLPIEQPTQLDLGGQHEGRGRDRARRAAIVSDPRR